MKKSVNQVRVGAVMSYINIALGSLVPMFYTPVMLKLLGQDEFGLNKLANTVTGYLSLISLGLGSAMVRYYTKYRAEGDKEGEENIFGLFRIIYGIISAASLVVGIVLTFVSAPIYQGSLQGSSLFGISKVVELQILVFLLTIQTAICFFSAPYTSVITSHERFVILQSINILSTVLAPALNLVILYIGFGNIGTTLWGLIFTIITQIIYVIYVRKSIGLKPKYNNVPKHMLKEIFAFSFWIFIMSIIDRLYNSTDTLIIGYIPKLSTIGVAVYGIGATMSTMIGSFSTGLTGVLTPKINMLVFSGKDNKELTDTMIRIGRLQAYIVSLLVSGFAAFGIPFFNLWVGEGYSNAYVVALAMTIPACVPLVQNVALNIIIAQNRLKFRTIVFFSIAVANVIGTVLCVNQFGIIGAALVTGIAYTVGQGFVMNWYYRKKIGLEIPRFWKNVGPLFIMPSILCIITLFVQKFFAINSWMTLLISILVYTVIFFAFNWKVVMNNYEKDIFLNPIRKIARKFKRS